MDEIIERERERERLVDISLVRFVGCHKWNGNSGIILCMWVSGSKQGDVYKNTYTQRVCVSVCAGQC